MKKVNVFLCFLISMVTMLSCNKKDDFNYPAGKVGISTIVYFPSIAINGDRLTILTVGQAYTDPGATATLGSTAASYTTTGSVDVNTPGVYVINYTAVNAQGDAVSDWRTVAVIGNDVASNDFSGTYASTSNGVTSTWTKTGNGIYTVENPGGATVGVGETVIAVNYTGTKISIPQQIAPAFGGECSSSNETYTATPAPATYSWVFHNSSYGTSLRTFVKQ